MPSTKETVRALLDRLPDDCRLEDVFYNLYVIQSVGADAYDRMDADYQAMAERAASLTLDDLRRDSVPVLDIEDAIA